MCVNTDWNLLKDQYKDINKGVILLYTYLSKIIKKHENKINDDNGLLILANGIDKVTDDLANKLVDLKNKFLDSKHNVLEDIIKKDNTSFYIDISFELGSISDKYTNLMENDMKRLCYKLNETELYKSMEK